MGIFNRLLSPFRDAEKRSKTGDTFAEAFGIRPTWSGQHVSAHTADALSTVQACVTAISSTIATLPVYVYRTVDGVRVEAPNHPFARLVRQPNPNQTWPDFAEWTLCQVLTHGNAVAEIIWDGAGRPTALMPTPWNCVSMVRLPSGKFAYDVVAYTGQWGGTGQTRRLLADDVLHLKDRSDDGIVGRSRLSRACETLGLAQAESEAASKLFANGMRPAGVMSAPAYLNAEQRAQANVMIGKFSGAQAAGRTVLLEGGWKYEPITIPPNEAQLLESRRFSVEEICRVFNVPPPIVQDYSRNTFTNAATAVQLFAQQTLTPWVRKIEAEFQRSVFGANSAFSMEIDMSGLTRGDYATRWAVWENAVKAGILTPDEVREQEGWGPMMARNPQNDGGV